VFSSPPSLGRSRQTFNTTPTSKPPRRAVLVTMLVEPTPRRRVYDTGDVGTDSGTFTVE
jgi:hypothetical protein